MKAAQALLLDRRRTGLRSAAAAALCIGAWLYVAPAQAWTGNGHRLVADLAQSQLSPATRSAVEVLLAQEPGSSLATVSTWADEHRNPTTAAWHYVNFPRGDCHYEAERDCPDGKCVVAALQRQLAVLASDAPADKRLLALKYVVHFAADIHQPLHAGFGDDRGGNSHQLQAFGRGTNLHAVWDWGLGALTDERIDETRQRLKRQLTAHRAGKDRSAEGSVITDVPVSPVSPLSMAQASCRIASTDGFYPRRVVTPDYVERYSPVVDSQLLLAARRLAEMLEDALGSRPTGGRN